MRKLLFGSMALLSVVSLVYAAPPPAIAPPPPVEGPVADRAVLIAPAPIPDRVARAETIVTGKVTSIEEKTVSASPFPGQKEKVDYVIAVVKIDDAIQGAKGLTHIKVGFQAPQAGGPGGPGRPIIRPGRGQAKLDKDQEVLLFLTPHHDAEFQVMQAYFDVVDKSADTYAKDLEATKKCVKLLAEPEKGLKSKDAQERLDTAALLIFKYRAYKPSDAQPKEEPIDADMSKLIMNALADGDWTPPKVGGPGANFQMTPQALFFRLGVTEKDGWKPPQDGTKFQEAVETWVKENKDKYRIKKLVYANADKKDDKKEPKKEK
jgi:hypothetical protein